MQADYSYSASGLLQRVTLGNGARAEYTYDAAGRVRVIDHQND